MSLGRHEHDRDKLHSSRRARLSRLFHRSNQSKTIVPSIAASDGSDTVSSQNVSDIIRTSLAYRASNDIDNASIRTRASKNLWLQAWEELSRDEPKLRLYTPDGKDDSIRELPQELLDAVHKDLQDVVGHRQVLLSAIAEYTSVYIKAGERATSFDSSGYAMLPWAAIQFLYQASLRNLKLRDLILDHLKPAIFFLAWSRIQEALYSRENIESVLELRPILRNFYRTILKYLVTCQSHVQNPATRVGLQELIFLRASEDFQALIESFISLSQKVQELNLESPRDQLNNVSAHGRKLNNLNSDLRSVSNVATLFHDVYKRTHANDANTPVQEDLHGCAHAKYAALPRTALWLHSQPKILSFLSTSQSEIIWLHGSSGFGKSTLCATLLRRLREGRISRDELYPLDYFFSSSATDVTNITSNQAVISLLDQLNTITTDESLKANYAATMVHGISDPQVRLSDLVDMAIRYINKRNVTYLFVDALDECVVEQQESLLQSLARMVAETKSTVKIFIASRYDKRLSALFAGIGKISDISVGLVENNLDVQKYVDAKFTALISGIENHLGGAVEEELLPLIKEFLISGAEGNFRWLEIQCKYLLELNSMIDIKAHVECPPPDLTESYKEFFALRLAAIQSKDEKKKLQRAIQWLLVLRTPLKADVFLSLINHNRTQSEALALEDLFGLLNGWIADGTNDAPITFAHGSVRDFFINFGDELEPPILLLKGNDIAACTSLIILSDTQTASTHPAKVYVYRQWPAHAKAAENGGPSSQYTILIQKFLHPRSAAFQSWCKSLAQLEHFNKECVTAREGATELHSVVTAAEPHPILLVSQYNLLQTLDFLLPMVKLDDIRRLTTKDGRGALHFAVQNGFTTVITRLLAKGLDVNLKHEKTKRCAKLPLQIAIEANQAEMVKWLVSKGARAELPCFNTDTAADMSPLGLSLWLGLEDISHFLFKVSSLAGITLYDEWLFAACHKGMAWFAEGFVDLGAKVNSSRLVQSRLETPLSLAASSGSEPLVDALLSHGASLDIDQALANAAAYRHLSILETLLKNQPDATLSSALVAAAKSRSVSTKNRASITASDEDLKCLELLIAKGAEPNHADKVGRIALNAAAADGETDAVKSLLAARADPNLRDSLFSSALEAAVSAPSRHDRQIAIIDALLDHGARVDQPGSILVVSLRAISPLTREVHTLALIDHLLSKGADVNALGIDGSTPLYHACLHGGTSIVKRLLEAGASLDRPAKEASPLSAAFSRGNMGIVDMLMGRGARINPSNSSFGDALVDAARLGQTKSVNLLIENKVAIDSGRTQDRMTALCSAASGNHLELMQVLLDAGARVDGSIYDATLKDRVPGFSPLIAAMNEGHTEAVRLLLKNHADVNVQCHWHGFEKHDRSALMMACARGDLNLVKLLLENGAKSHRKDRLGRTALHFAVAQPNVELVEFLLDRGASIDATNATTGSPLQWSLVNENRSIANFHILLERGADVNVDGGRYGTVLQAAAYLGMYDQVSLLIKRGANVNKVGGRYGSALHAAVRNGYVETATLLIAHGADVNAARGRYGTPLRTALLSGHREVAALLMANGARRGKPLKARTGTIRGKQDPGEEDDDDAHSITAEAEVHILEAAALSDELYPESVRKVRRQAATASFDNFSTMW